MAAWKNYGGGYGSGDGKGTGLRPTNSWKWDSTDQEATPKGEPSGYSSEGKKASGRSTSAPKKEKQNWKKAPDEMQIGYPGAKSESEWEVMHNHQEKGTGKGSTAGGEEREAKEAAKEETRTATAKRAARRNNAKKEAAAAAGDKKEAPT